MKVGFIGTGSMGSLLIEAFVKAGAMHPANITVSSRTRSRAESLVQRIPGLKLAASNVEAARQADLLFLCVKPADFHAVLTELAPHLEPQQIAVSITSPVTLSQLECYLPCKVAKIIPSIVNAVRSGAVLMMWGSRLNATDQIRLMQLLANIGRPVEIAERDVRIASDLSSIGPAFFAYLLEEFIDSAVARAGIDRAAAETLAKEMLLGTARLLVEQGFSPHELQSRVSVPGGITADALEVLKDGTLGAFGDVFRMTHEKFASDLEKVALSLQQPPVPKH